MIFFVTIKSIDHRKYLASSAKVNAMSENKPGVAVGKDNAGIGSNSKWLFVRFLVALILLVAASLKAHQLSTTPTLDNEIFHSRWFNVLVVEFELFFGLWMAFGFFPKLTRLATMGCFLTFVVVSCCKALSGETSCGCFGAVEVHPWITMLLDCGIVIMLWYFRPYVDWGGKTDKSMILSFVVSWLVVALPLSWLMLSFQPSRIASSGEIIGTSDTMMLYPREWLGLQLPILPFVEIDEDLQRGRWIVVFYMANCKKCKEYFAEWQNSGFPVIDNGDKRVAMLEISGQPENGFRQTMRK
ncbi:MAG: hypothetical protein LBJ00_00730 [Planctomycetaceae bacterium]|nr:hypothetical protein [Planctomycetaceae bacterium]